MADLHVWMNGLHVGVWSTLRTGTPVLRYDERWVRADEGRALSLSLPFTANGEHRGDVVTRYFDNLLPDSDAIRRRLRSRFRARSTDAFDLLAAGGRDCVGAVQLLPGGEAPAGCNEVDAEPLDDAAVERTLVAVTSDAALGRRDDEDLRHRDRTVRLDPGLGRHALRPPLGRHRRRSRRQDEVPSTGRCLDRPAAAGGFLPGAGREPGPEVPGRRRPFDANASRRC